MYTNHFGLDEPPFSITPDPRYLYFGERHTEALAHLLYGVSEDGGFVMLTGEVGTGKTTLLRRLLKRLPEDLDAALVLNPRQTVPEFLTTVCEELAIDTAGADGSIKALVDRLNRYLLDAHARGRRTVIVMDEAQDLDREVLEQVRLLTNLETEREKLLKMVLVGQPELRELIARSDLRQLRQRITARYHLQPLTVDETASYVRHRLAVAGGEYDLFTPGALRRVHRRAQGIPRLINVICDRALLGAFAQERESVDEALVDQAWQEAVSPDAPQGSRRARLPWVAAALAITAAGLAGVVLMDQLQERRDRVDAGADTPGAVVIAPEPDPVDADPEVPADAGPAPVGTTPSPVDLEALLAASDPVDAWRHLYARWGAQAERCEAAASFGLSCERLTGSWTELVRLDLPAVLELSDELGRPRQVALVGADDDRVALATDDGPVWVDRDRVAERWFGAYALLWERGGAPESLLAPGMRSASVRWIRDRLGVPQGEDPELYDTSLASAVRDLQRRSGLRVDGLVGLRTAIAMAHEGAADRPRLRVEGS